MPWLSSVIVPAVLVGVDVDIPLGRTVLRLSGDAAVVEQAKDALPLRNARGQTLRLQRTVAFAAEAQALAQVSALAPGLEDIRPGPLPGTWLAEATDPLRAVAVAQTLAQVPGVAWAEPQIIRPRFQRVLPNDPLLGEAWHLDNDGTVAVGATAGADLNVQEAWESGWTGSGRLIAIIDTAFHQDHPDLTAVWRTDIALNVRTGTSAPWTTSPTVDHATFCAGIAAARGNNDVGIAGVAFNAQVVPINLLQASATDANEARALRHQVTLIDVSSNSWGPSDEIVTEGPASLALTAFETAVTTGRGGRGTVITWAAGNGQDAGDNLAWDGYASDRRVLAIGALGANGERTYYSEGGPALFAMAPGGDDEAGIVSTAPPTTWSEAADLWMGTSFATPGAAGVAALVIHRRPDLGWRDVRRVLALSAAAIDGTDSAWQRTTDGHPWHPGFGFGRLDASAAVRLAADITTLPAQTPVVRGSWTGSLGIPDQTSDGDPTVTIAFPMTPADDFRVESVEFFVDSLHSRQGDLDFSLTSPQGRTVTAEGRTDDAAASVPWTFTAIGFLDEPGRGTWTLKIRDRRLGRTGTVSSARLALYGYRSSGALESGQSLTVSGAGTSPSGSSAPTDPLAPVSTPKGTTGDGGCGVGAGGLALAALALAWRRRGVGIRPSTSSP